MTEHMHSQSGNGSHPSTSYGEERYRRLVEVSPAALCIVTQGRIAFMNKTGLDLFGATDSGQIIGRSIYDFFHPEQDGPMAGRIKQALDQGDALPFVEHRVLRLDGKPIEIELAAAPLTDSGQAAMQVVVRDITDRRQLEAQLRQSQKMEAFGQLAGGVAHDFNNMLTVINGHCDLLVEDDSLSDSMRRSVDQIRDAGRRAATLTSQLLAFSRRQVLQPKLVNLNVILAGMEQILKTLTGDDIELMVRLDDKLNHIRADPGQIEQAIINLAVNARDAMPDGGRLTVSTENTILDEAAIKRNRLDTKPGPHAKLTIRDTGVGMDAQTLAQIFEPFFTTKPKGKGTGLGLATVYGVVQQSGGAIAVESQKGIGTAVTIYLPIVEGTAVQEPADSCTLEELGGTETVLVVEDDPGVRGFVCETLKIGGYQVMEAKHGVEGLMTACQKNGAIDLVLTDVVMPQMNGRELVEQLRSRWPGLKAIFMSGYTDDAVLRHGVSGASFEFLQKPFLPAALARKVRKVLDAGTATMVPS